MGNMGNNVHDSSISKLNIHSVDAMTHLGKSEKNTVHKVTDQYCQPQNIYKKQKKIYLHLQQLLTQLSTQ